jgi:lipooligosaccharide transport system permease protein
MNMVRQEVSQVLAVWTRHALRYRNSLLWNCIPPVSEPLIYLFAFGLGMGPFVGSIPYYGQSIEYFNFIAPGMIAVGILFQAFFEAAYGTFVRLKYQQAWQSMLTTPLRFRHVYFGDFLWAVTRGCIAGVLTALTAYAIGVLSTKTLLLALPLIVLGAAVFAALGMCAAGIVQVIDQLNVPVFLFVVPMFVLCGTYFPRDALPDGLRHFAAILPLAALVDLLRWPLARPDGGFWLVFVLLAWILALTRLSYRLLERKLYR